MSITRTGPIVGYLVIGTLAVLGAWALARSVPFELASYSAWAGIFLALTAAVSLVRPQRWLGIPTRARAGALLLAAGATAVTAILWPSAVERSSRPRHRIDDFLPQYQFAEYHEARTHAPLVRVLEAAREVALADLPAAILLLRLRELVGGDYLAPGVDTTPLIELLQSSDAGFLPLDVSNGRELVFGMAGRPWSAAPPPRVSAAAEFLAFHVPGHVRVAFDLRIVDEGGGVLRLSTETRILGNDAAARRTFARYWRLVYPGSAVIRRVWLDAIVARAERG